MLGDENQMDVLTVSAAKWGIQHAVFNLIRETNELEFEHTHMTLPIHRTPAGIDRFEILRKRWLTRLDSIRILYSIYAIHFFWFKVYRYLKDEGHRFEIIWLHSPTLLPLMPKSVESKTVVTIHGALMLTSTESHSFPISLYYSVLRRIQRRGIRHHTGVTYVAVQDEIANHIIDLGVPASQVHVIGNGVNVDRFSPNESSGFESDNAQRGITLVSVTRLIELKRPLLLLEVFERTLRKTTMDLRLVIVGDGPLRARAERFVADRQLQDSVSFLGVIDFAAMPDVYNSADIFVLSSEIEGEPLVLYEAMASGLPCIVPNIPSCQFIGEADCGVVVDFRDIQGAASEIDEFISGNVELIGDNARDYAESNLAWSARAKEYARVFRHEIA